MDALSLFSNEEQNEILSRRNGTAVPDNAYGALMVDKQIKEQNSNTVKNVLRGVAAVGAVTATGLYLYSALKASDPLAAPIRVPNDIQKPIDVNDYVVLNDVTNEPIVNSEPSNVI